MSWNQIEQDKWDWAEDEELHVLIRHGNALVEYHNGWIHAYKVGDIVDASDPMATAVWKKSEYRDELKTAPEDLLWPALLSPVYVRF